MANKHQITNNKRKQQVMDKEKKSKNQNIVIANSKAKATRPITLEVLVQEKKLKQKRGGTRQYKFRTGSGGKH